MAIKTNSAAGGTNGTTVTGGSGGNSGGTSGDYFNQVTIAAGGALTFTSAQSAHGSLSYDVTSSSTGTFMQWNQTVPSLAFRFYMRLTELPSAAFQVAVARNATAAAARIVIDTAGKFVLQDTTGTNVKTFPTALPINTWVRLEIVVAPGSGAGDGTLKGAHYIGDSATPVDAAYSSTTTNLSTGSLTFMQFGRLSATYSGTIFFDDLALEDTTTNFIGPFSGTNNPPTVNAGLDQTAVEPWSTVTLTATTSDSDGTSSITGWSQISGSPTVTLSGSGVSRTFDAPATIAGTTLGFRATATDNESATATDDVSVTLLSVTERAPIGGVEVPLRIDDV